MIADNQNQEIDEGGQAFPGSDYGPTRNGMSLRDYFAGQAMGFFQMNFNSKFNPDLFARSCYLLADAMVAQSKKKVE